MKDKIELIRSIVNEECLTKDLKIVVLERAWIYIGFIEINEDFFTLKKASCIRIWGTDKGLGQLAIEGMQPHTKLDKCGTIHFNNNNLIYIIDCNEEKWRFYYE